MERDQGLTAEMYRAVVAIVDDRMKEIRTTRQDFDRLVEAQARTEAVLNRLTEAQAQTEARLQELAEAQARYQEASEARFARIEATLDQLIEAQARTEEELRKYREASEARFARIEATLDQLIEAQARTEARLQELAEAQARTEEEFRKYREASEARFARIEAVLEQVVVQLQKLTDRTGAMEGRLLELTYQQKAASYFGHLLRRLRVVSLVEIEDRLTECLTLQDFRDLLALDLLVSGRPRHLAEAPQVWLAVEVSATVDRRDVERARRRADLLRQAGLRAIPAVAGEDATVGAVEEARAHKVLMLQDGRYSFWEEALAEALQLPPAPATELSEPE